MMCYLRVITASAINIPSVIIGGEKKAETHIPELCWTSLLSNSCHSWWETILCQLARLPSVCWKRAPWKTVQTSSDRTRLNKAGRHKGSGLVAVERVWVCLGWRGHGYCSRTAASARVQPAEAFQPPPASRALAHASQQINLISAVKLSTRRKANERQPLCPAPALSHGPVTARPEEAQLSSVSDLHATCALIQWKGVRSDEAQSLADLLNISLIGRLSRS